MPKLCIKLMKLWKHDTGSHRADPEVSSSFSNLLAIYLPARLSILQFVLCTSIRMINSSDVELTSKHPCCSMCLCNSLSDGYISVKAVKMSGKVPSTFQVAHTSLCMARSDLNESGSTSLILGLLLGVLLWRGSALELLLSS